MEGCEFMLNRQTPEHDNRQDPFWSWAVLAALGEFQAGNIHFPALNLQSRFLPGDLILFRGCALKHRIMPFTGKQHISVAHFTHQSLWDAFDLTPPQTIHSM
ncbi:hypothetical protein C8F04DRAFT_970408 [Mycena alexandri]|uniref:Uncharacterized protein n=1 Tax=Mycena alexandri TaxID=1745969 RepID=A0AAD6S950_9AGAR|nr:hypothetical protein C8F04DRAFT_970408 [Mycena alexandri]